MRAPRSSESFRERKGRNECRPVIVIINITKTFASAKTAKRRRPVPSQRLRRLPSYLRLHFCLALETQGSKNFIVLARASPRRAPPRRGRRSVERRMPATCARSRGRACSHRVEPGSPSAPKLSRFQKFWQNSMPCKQRHQAKTDVHDHARSQDALKSSAFASVEPPLLRQPPPPYGARSSRTRAAPPTTS